MTPAIQRPDDITTRGVLLAEIPASEGQPYTIERRPGRVLRLARQQRNGVHVSLMLAAEDATSPRRTDRIGVGGLMMILTEAGTEIVLAEDSCGWYATHDGITYHLTATCTSTAKTPAKWCAR